jgi:sodium-dependent phosphate transporter
VVLFLQVCTACANSFAHGSNEVANAIGPLAAIYHVWQTGSVTAKNPVPTWLLAIGGVGITIGIATSKQGHHLVLHPSWVPS